MNYTSCERLMWAVLSAPAFKYIGTQEPDWELRAYRKKTKQIYHEIIVRTPDIGTLQENTLRICLSGGADEYTMIYHRCGLCGLGVQEGLFHLIKYMCALDYLSVELMGGTLFRTQTLAQGGDCCDFYVCRKGSAWEKEREANADGEEAL